MATVRDRVFTSLNQPKRMLGFDWRLLMGCGGVFGVLMLFDGGFWISTVIVAVLLGIGSVLEKRDPRFLDLLPLRFQLHSRYEAGRRAWK